MKVLSASTDGATVELTADEILAFNNALNEVLNGPDSIDEVEFHTRMGVFRDEAKRLLGELGQFR